MKDALIKLHVAVFLWGFTGVLGRLITLNEGLLVWYRIFFTVVSLFFLMRWKKEMQTISSSRKWILFGIGGLIALHWCFFFGSIKYANVSIALTCFSSSGLLTALLEPLMTRKKIKPIEVVLGLVTVAGIYLIFHFDPQYKLGIALGFICTILSAAFTVLNKKQVEFVQPKTMMLYEMGGGLITLTILMPFYLRFFPAATLYPNFTDSMWLLILSWACTIYAMDLSLQALKKISAFTQNLTVNLEPVYGIILAFIIYHENKYLSKWFYFGFTLIIVAVVLQMARVFYQNRKKATLENVIH